MALGNAFSPWLIGIELEKRNHAHRESFMQVFTRQYRYIRAVLLRQHGGSIHQSYPLPRLRLGAVAFYMLVDKLERAHVVVLAHGSCSVVASFLRP